MDQDNQPSQPEVQFSQIKKMNKIQVLGNEQPNCKNIQIH